MVWPPLAMASSSFMPPATASAAAGVDGLDLFHLFAGQAVALHGDQSCGPGDHRDDAEQHDDHHVHARGVRIVLGGQGVQADEGNGNADDRAADRLETSLSTRLNSVPMMPGMYLPER